ncbi:DNA cytosine methyltransferase [Klebsiella pneumoniae]|nr:DNA cytosine methyltransferase [Klebsiella pneumoniae]ELA1308054.1 DNA cytosine methyltransferase [Klebsiella pneumoniae]HDZ2531273.1 DNA cytosine methyltransferase [Klebsiella pneumoniae]HDZ2539745.1 DNA cytosine methyltransferase [Klebsiella pneumoniae]
MITYGSVCSGIEAASVAWEPLGWRPVWFAEIEPFPAAVLASRWPNVVNLGDMTKIAAGIRAGRIEAPDVLVGGTPCQAFSIAGLRGGLNDQRGQLTLAFVDLVNAIDEKRREQNKAPVIVVWENVPGVLSSKDNAFGCFLAGLAGESDELQPTGKKWTNAGCVYGSARAISWRILDTQYFGVAQRRRRVFVIASARIGFYTAKILFELDSMRRDIAPSREAGAIVAASAGDSVTNGSHWDGASYPHPTLNQAHNTGGIGQSNQELFSQRGSGIVHHTQFGMELAGTLTARHDSSPCADRGMNIIAMAHGQGGAEIKTDDSAPTLTCNHEAPIVFKRGPAITYSDISRTLLSKSNVSMSEDMETYAIHGTQDPGVNKELAHVLARNQGQENAIVYAFKAGQGAKVGGIGFAEEQSPTLLAASSGTNLSPTVIRGMSVRRLTPIECERLQGFPDNHTLISGSSRKKLPPRNTLIFECVTQR